VVVMCSDGLVDMVPDPTIREILLSSSGLEVAGVNLIGAANTAGGVDNISVILLHVLAG
jgi:serine/threonine protein phosphatase PrpC